MSIIKYYDLSNKNNIPSIHIVRFSEAGLKTGWLY